MDISKTGANATRAANLESTLSRAGEAGGIGATTAAFQRAEKRAQQQRNVTSVTSVEISVPGKIKSALAELQTASRALVADPTKSPSNDELKTAASDFVAAVNKLNQTARQTNTQKIAQKLLQADGTQGPTEGQRTRSAELDRGRQLESEKSIPIEANAFVAALSANAPLQQIGITAQADSKLAIDSRKLDAALQIDPVATRSVLARAAESVNGVVSRELSSTGNIGNSPRTTNNSSDRDRSSESRQTEQLAQATVAQQTRSERAKDLSNTLIAGGVEAYQRVFTG